MPVSKKRKKKNQKPMSPPLPKSVRNQPKKGITWQRVALYVISALMIISLAASFLVSGVTPQHGGAVPQNGGTQVETSGDNLLDDSSPAEDVDEATEE